jgi:hypothetical protein
MVTRTGMFYSVDLKTKIVRDLTPFQGVKAQNLLTNPRHANEILVGLNLRVPRVADMYRINLTTVAVALDTENPGDVLSWTSDPDFVIRAATTFNLKTAETTLRVRDGQNQPWRDLVVWPFVRDGNVRPDKRGDGVADFASDGYSLFGVSALHSDTQRLVRIDLHTGRDRSLGRTCTIRCCGRFPVFPRFSSPGDEQPWDARRGGSCRRLPAI